jgi:glutamyl-tRNA synthetase
LVRVRFAPSPTGNLHIGGARTALFNWLYARAKGGKFILRIEDTDAKRSEKKYLDEIEYSLTWLGFDWDEIYFQSKRFEIYKELAEKLVAEGKAEHNEGAIIFKVPSKKIKIVDLIHGDIEFDAETIKDQVLIKSDGTPTYNFACVVDDAQMNITHVIRGDDHISNTPKQILLYEALGYKIPEFAHLPLILSGEGGRMSKRKGATAISEYRAMGYLASALVNYLLLLGWSPGKNQELVDLKTAVKQFNITKANKTSATFDLDKLDWINSQYIKKENPEKILEFLLPLLQEKNYIKEGFDRNYLLSLIKLYQARMPRLVDFIDWADFFFTGEVVLTPELVEKHFNQDFSKEFSLLAERLIKLDNFTPEQIEKSFRDLVTELGIQAKVLVHPVRVALTGKEIGPGLFETMYFLGKEKTIDRLKKVATLQKEKGGI